jgi:hypothetical protein
MPDDWSIVTRHAISAEALADVVEGRIAALRLGSYCSPELCARLSDSLLAHPQGTPYEVRWYDRNADLDAPFQDRPPIPTDVIRIGPSDSTVPDKYSLGATYNDSVLRSLAEFRALAAPYLAPMDRLRLELDEHLPGGAGVHTYENGSKAMVGLARVMRRSDAILHADTGRRGCLTANVYLRMPPEGGGTKIWRHTGDFLQSRGSYMFAPDEVPADAPVASFCPLAGDLVIWNPSFPHQVLPFAGGPRISQQTWVKLLNTERGVAAQLLN